MSKSSKNLKDNKAKFFDPQGFDIRGNLVIGSNVEIDVNVIFEGNVKLGDGVKIGANCIINNSNIGNFTIIKPFSMIEDSTIGEFSSIGPYGRIRPGTEIGDYSQIGNFVEIKNSNVGNRCQINHHSFVGDADIVKDVILGAGTITCNHNGVSINRISIEQGAYIGSGANLIAPLIIGENSTIGAGSTITEDAPKNKLTIARSKQVTIKNWKNNRLLDD
jgi:bifunctional UDP-N-acetylglucosamine pyrophosphorylase / glucosamine-1-phosphate N-acetyltransferase